MSARTLICFPISEAPGLRADAAQLALGLAARGDEVLVFGPLGPWRHALRLAGVTATEFSLPGDERRFTRALQDAEPQVIHAFGAEAAHLAMPCTLLAGAGGVVTLGHEDLSRLNPARLRTASAIFVPCEHLREQVTRRLPGVPVVPTGYLLSPPSPPPAPALHFLADELGLNEGAPVVLLADHFRNSETEVAMALIAATPHITQRVPGVQVVIAGGGVRLGELEQLAYEVNDELGYRAVLLPGYREDVSAMLALATVAVGSGRFAAEALGAGVALVAAGHSGLVGTVTEDTAQVAAFTCCGRHGHLEPVTAKGLATEIAGLFAYADHRERFAAQGQQRMLAEAERELRATQIAAYYSRTSPNGVGLRTPQRITAVLPDDLREMLFCLPAVCALPGQFPLAKVTLVAAPAHAGLLRQLGVAERVLSRPGHWRAAPAFLRELGHPRPDVGLAFAEDLGSALITAASRAPHRLGFAEGPGSILFSDHLHVHTEPSPARALTLVHPLGIASGAAVPSLAIPLPVQAAAEASLLAAGVERSAEVVLLCPSTDDRRAWHRSHWTNLVRLLADEQPERLVVLGDGIDLPAGVATVPMPEDSLHLAALLARAKAVVAPDSGTLHLADLLGVPTIGLFGPTAPEVCALPNDARLPLCHRDLPCQPCATPCEERHCLRAITPAEVAVALTGCFPRQRELVVA